jgi:hypothetical protein
MTKYQRHDRVPQANTMSLIPNTELSTLSRKYSVDDVTVKVDIFRPTGGDAWQLEVTSSDDQITDWGRETFATDREAWNEFLYVVETEGITAFV